MNAASSNTVEIGGGMFMHVTAFRIYCAMTDPQIRRRARRLFHTTGQTDRIISAVHNHRINKLSPQ